MEFFNSAIDVLQTLVIALGAGLGVWGGVNLLEGYGSDNPGAKSQGMKQLMAGGGVALIGTTLVPQSCNPSLFPAPQAGTAAHRTGLYELARGVLEKEKTNHPSFISGGKSHGNLFCWNRSLSVPGISHDPAVPLPAAGLRRLTRGQGTPENHRVA